MNSAIQFYEFMGCLYAGIIMGIVYGILDTIHKIIGEKPLFTVLSDALFIIISTFIACAALYFLTYGRFAFYHLLSFVAGIVMYVKSVHHIVCKLFLNWEK